MTSLKFIIAFLLVAGAASLIILKETKRTSLPDIAESISTFKDDQEIKLRRVIDLGAGKCIPCKKMAPILEEIKKEYGGILDVKVIDVWKNPDASAKYGIRLIPTQIFYDASGKELTRHEGFMGKKDILETFKRFGIKFEKR